jgi:hypothetical protein
VCKLSSSGCAWEFTTSSVKVEDILQYEAVAVAAFYGNRCAGPVRIHCGSSRGSLHCKRSEPGYRIPWSSSLEKPLECNAGCTEESLNSTDGATSG